MTDIKDGTVVEHEQAAATTDTAIARRADEQHMQLAQMPDAISIMRKPKEVIALAVEASQALMGAISKKRNVVTMGGEQYIEVEDWTLVAAFHGCTLQLESDEYVEYGGAQGWEATVALIARDGRVVGRATMMCLNDEEKWSERPRYEWCQLLKQEDAIIKDYGAVEDGGQWYARGREAPSSALQWEKVEGRNKPISKRLEVGVDKVPQFQLRSMAQTRAAGKVCRLNLAYIPMLAGLKTTPAEELSNGQVTPQQQANTQSGQQAAQQPAERTNAHTAGNDAARGATRAAGSGALYEGYPAATRADADKVNATEVSTFWDFAQKQNVSAPAVAKWLRETFNCKSSSEMTVAQLRKAVRYVQGDLDPEPATQATREVGEEG